MHRPLSAIIPHDYPTRAASPKAARAKRVSCDTNTNTSYSRHMSAAAFSFMAAALLMGAGATPAILSSLGVQGVQELVWWLWAMPLMAGSLAGFGIVLSYAKKDEESKRRTRGRALFGLVVGLAVPRAALYIHPALLGLLNDPFILLGIGTGVFLAGFGAAVGVMKWVEKRAGDVAYDQIEKYAKDKLPPTDKPQP